MTNFIRSCYHHTFFTFRSLQIQTYQPRPYKFCSARSLRTFHSTACAACENVTVDVLAKFAFNLLAFQILKCRLCDSVSDTLVLPCLFAFLQSIMNPSSNQWCVALLFSEKKAKPRRTPGACYEIARNSFVFGKSSTNLPMQHDKQILIILNSGDLIVV